MPSRRLPTISQYQREAQVNRIQRDLHKLEMLKCLAHNAPAVMAGTSVQCEECADLYKCERVRSAIGEVRI